MISLELEPIEMIFKDILGRHPCTDDDRDADYTASVTYTSLSELEGGDDPDDRAEDQGAFHVSLDSGGNLRYCMPRQDVLRDMNRDVVSLVIRVFGNRDAGASIPTKYVYGLLKTSMNLPSDVALPCLGYHGIFQLLQEQNQRIQCTDAMTGAELPAEEYVVYC